MARLVATLGWLCAAVSWGCGDDGGTGASGGATTHASTGGEAEGGSANAGAASFGGESSSGGASSAGGGELGGASSGGSSAGGAPNVGLDDVGTLVVLGDSIGDGGGQAPFYYDLLHDQLDARYGGIDYKHKAESGSKTSDLLGQINDLPSALAGPVVVAITSGGNDMKAALPLILGGGDAAARAQMGANVAAALDALLEPGRFGAGVTVHVFEANIYDASDGQGDFGSHGCAFGQGVPAIPTDGFFASWNAEIEGAAADHGQPPMDMHGFFYGHGYHSSPNWYASDCTHPSSIGHASLAGLFYSAITGDDPP